MFGDFRLLSDYNLLGSWPNDGPVFNGRVEVSIHRYMTSSFPSNIGEVAYSHTLQLSGNGVVIAPVNGSLNRTLPHPLLTSTGFNHDIFYGIAHCSLGKTSLVSNATFTPQSIFAGIINITKERVIFESGTTLYPPVPFTGHAQVEKNRQSIDSSAVYLPLYSGYASIQLNKPQIFAQNVPIAVVNGAANLNLNHRTMIGLGKISFPRYPYQITVNMVRNDELLPKVNLHVGDDGIQFQVTVKTPDNFVLRLNEATYFRFLFQRPEENFVIEKTPQYLYNGSDGVLVCELNQDDLSISGTYRFQLVIGFGDEIKRSEVRKFKVNKSLPIEV